MSVARSVFENKLRLFGKWVVTPIFSIGSGIITTVAISSLGIISGLALPWLIPIFALVFLAESAISIYLFKNSVPDTLAAIFVQGIFKKLSLAKKILLSLGVFSALGGGLALGALTYTSGVIAISAILGLFSFSFPPLAIGMATVLAFVGFIAFSSLLIKWISTAIENNMYLQPVNFFKNIFTRDQTKPLAQQVLEGIFKFIFTTAIVLISIVGTLATLGTMQKGLIQFLSLIPNANLLAVKIASGIIAYGLMGVARLPWALQSVCSVFSFLGEIVGRTLYRVVDAVGRKMGIIHSSESQITIADDKNEYSWKDISIFLLKSSAVVVHGISFGALAKSGGGKVVSEIMTDLHFPLDTATIDVVGQHASMATGSMMAGGIGAFSLFANSINTSTGIKASESENEVFHDENSKNSSYRSG